MGPKNNVACRWFDEVWNKGDSAAIHRLGAPDMVAHGADGVVRSPAEFVVFQQALRAAVPDLHVDVTHCVEGRDMIALQWIARGTHRGEAPGMPKPSGRGIEISGLTMVRVQDGRCAEGWDDYDAADLMRQLSAI